MDKRCRVASEKNIEHGDKNAVRNRRFSVMIRQSVKSAPTSTTAREREMENILCSDG